MSNHFRVGDRVILSPSERDTRLPTDHWRNMVGEGTVVDCPSSSYVFVRFDGVSRDYLYTISMIAHINSSSVIVSSLDYNSTDELTQEDKDIIKEYLDGC